MAQSYRDIKEDVLARLRQGEWGPGDLLPAEADLAASYECARATVNRALRELAEDGYIDRRRKSGTRVREAPRRQARFAIPFVRDEIEALGADYGYALLSREAEGAPGWLAERLGLAPGAPVLRVGCLHLADGRPFQHEDRWISLDALPEAEDAPFEASGPSEWLVSAIPFSDVEIGFSAVAAESGVARALGCAVGDALFLMDRATWFEGRPVTFVRLTYRPGYRKATRY